MEKQEIFIPTAAGAAVVETAGRCWNAMDDFRKERERNVGYTFGDQWRDMINDNGRIIREEDYIRSQGNHPFKNNLIRRLVRNVVGVFRDRYSARLQDEGLSVSCRVAGEKGAELMARTMEEYLISGMAVHRKWWRRDAGGKVFIHTDMVSPAGFFFDPMARDPRGGDMTVLGQMHELGFGAFCREFANTPEAYRAAVKKYGFGNVKVIEMWRRENRGRLLCHDTAKGRVIKVDEKVWSGAAELRKMPSRWILDDVWRCYYATPDGVILREGDSPLPLSGHPYVVKAYPFLDGEVHSLVADIIDQQRYTNRLITLYDWVMRASAKGVLLFPENALPAGGDIAGVVDQWSRFNGVIVYDGESGAQPTQVSNLGASQGVSDLLAIQLKMMEDIAGVNGALQGRLDSQTMSGTLYEQQTQNSLISLRDLLDSFDSFIADSIAKEQEIRAIKI